MNNISNPEDYKPLQHRISRKMLQKGVGKEILILFRNSYNTALSDEIILSRKEKKLLSKLVLEEVFVDIQKELYFEL
jgi:hypothetical protein